MKYMTNQHLIIELKKKKSLKKLFTPLIFIS